MIKNIATKVRGVLADCPSKVLAVGKYKGWHLDQTPLSYQKWAKSEGYPETLFVSDKSPNTNLNYEWWEPMCEPKIDENGNLI